MVGCSCRSSWTPQTAAAQSTTTRWACSSQVRRTRGLRCVRSLGLCRCLCSILHLPFLCPLLLPCSVAPGFVFPAAPRIPWYDFEGFLRFTPNKTEVCVFNFLSIYLGQMLRVNITGNRPLVLMSRSTIIIDQPIIIPPGTLGVSAIACLRVSLFCPSHASVAVVACR